LTLGYDAVGRIDDIGSKVDTSKLHYKPGSRVAVLAVTGCQADYVCVDPDRVFPIPEEIDGAKAVALVLSCSSSLLSFTVLCTSYIDPCIVVTLRYDGITSTDALCTC
jgi:NADPH:quinone reductase-like Zn-dependent oxidoreductase